jgi:hypothetical protein
LCKTSDRVLREKKDIDHSELHTGIKRKCKSLQRKAQAVVTRLAPGFLYKVWWPLDLNITAINLLFLIAFIIQMQFSEAENKQHILINSEFSQPDGLQLNFWLMGKYAASTFMSHIHIPFNCSGLLGLQDKLNDRLDNFFNVLKNAISKFPAMTTAL